MTARPRQPTPPRVRPRPRSAPDAAVSASNPGRVFRAEWRASFRRVAVGHTYARSWWKKSTVVLVLWDSGKARVTDAGEHQSSVLIQETGHTENQRTWSNSWQGTWKRRGKRLLLRLSPKHLSCTRVHSHTRRGATTAKTKRSRCPKSPKRLKLVCKRETLILGSRFRRAPTTAPPEPVWRCSTHRSSASTHGTPDSWVFGVKSCLRQVGGRRKSYQRCPSSKSTTVIKKANTP